ncbi:Uncharacterised protein [Mycobacteroides abscessus subsp. abscessus]|nr:Uncharacterised protein [Mycobacteroides abscessus subsp. abscessus]
MIGCPAGSVMVSASPWSATRRFDLNLAAVQAQPVREIAESAR